MGSIGKHLRRLAAVLSLGMAAVAFLGIVPTFAQARAAEVPNDRLLVRYAMDDTATGAGQKIVATKWDSAAQKYVAAPAYDATITLQVNNRRAGTVTATDGVSDGALAFTESAHARSNFHLPENATGMTISMWVKNVNTYWSSLLEFWDGTNGGRFGKGTMQGNGGRSNESDAWSANCPAHNSATIAAGGGWDSFCINVNSGDNGGAAVDPMVADTWYQVTFALTASEMRAYRDGVLKQTFDTKGDAPGILASIMKAATNQEKGQFGIRLSLDENHEANGDVLDELRIYNGAMTEEEVLALYFSYDPAAEMPYYFPDEYDVSGLGYPEEILLGGASEVRDENGVKKGTTAEGIEYSYTPIKEAATPERDAAGLELTLTRGEQRGTKTMRFRRNLGLTAETLGYRLGQSGENVPLPVPEDGKDIVVTLPAGTDLSAVCAGEMSAKRLEGDTGAQNYEMRFEYDAEDHIARIFCIYTPFRSQQTIYTVVFRMASTETFLSAQITGGKAPLVLTPASFEGGKAEVFVESLTSFTLGVHLTLAEGATGTTDYTFTEEDLAGGLTFAVKSEQGTETKYTLTPVENSSDAALSALSLEGYTIAFSPETLTYRITVEKDAGAALLAKLTATPHSGKAAVQKIYDAAARALVVVVTAQDGTVRRYTISLIEQDTDATLSGISVGGTPIAFDPAVRAYTVKYKGALPEITATAASEKAKVSVGSPDGEGAVTITVTAESGAKLVYTVTLLKMSTDTSLSAAIGATALTFTEGVAEYEAPAGTQLGLLPLVLTAAEGAEVTTRLDAQKCEISIVVTAEDGIAAQYTVRVKIQAASFAAGEVEDNSPKQKGNGAVIGGSVAGGVCALAAVGIVLFVVLKRKKG